MKMRFRSSWKITRLALLLVFLAGCAKHQTRISLEEFRSLYSDNGYNYKVYSPNNKVQSLFKTYRTQGKTPSGKEIFSKYCKNGKQVSNSAINLKAIIHKGPKGIPLDLATHISKEQKNRIRDALKEFYWIASQGTRRISLSKKYRKFITASVPSKVAEDFSSSYLNYRIPRHLFRQQNYKKDLFIKYRSLNGLRYHNVSLVLDRRNKFIYIFLGEIPRFSFEIDRDEPLFGKKKVTALGWEKFGHQGPFLSPSNKNLGVYVWPKSKRSPYSTAFDDVRRGLTFGFLPKGAPKNKTDITPMVDAYFVDSLMFNGYTMLIPAKVQKKYFTKSTSQRYRSWKPFFTKNKGFDISLAVNKREELWITYFQTFTTVKESPSENPNHVNFEVSLDLNLFCAYGRPVSDLTSK